MPKLLIASNNPGKVAEFHAFCRCEGHVPLAGHHEPMKCGEGLLGSIERTCGACPEHRRRKAQKLTGGMGGVPPGPFFLVGAEQRRAMRSNRGERQERIIFHRCHRGSEAQQSRP
jgi:hypothetical protein